MGARGSQLCAGARTRPCTRRKRRVNDAAATFTTVEIQVNDRGGMRVTNSQMGKARRRRYDEKWPVVGIRVDPEMRMALVNEAKRRSTTVSALLRERLEQPMARIRNHDREVKAAWNEAKTKWFRIGYRSGYVAGWGRMHPEFEVEWIRGYPGIRLRR